MQTRITTKLLLLPVPDVGTHLSAIPDETFLGDLLLPGTHQSLALRGCMSLLERCSRIAVLTFLQGPH